MEASDAPYDMGLMKWAKGVNVSVSQGAEVNTSDSKAICDLVGNVPLAIKVLSAILSPPVKISVSYVIQRLNETAKKLKFMANSADRVDKDRLLSAIELAFEFIKPEYQICSLLLVKLPGSFALDMVSSIVTSDMFEDWEDFNINDWLYDLSAKSFLEQVSFESLLTHKQLQGRYHFHVLIRDYLESSKDNYNISKPLETLWTNYFKWLYSDRGDAYLIENLSQEDIDEILAQGDTFPYSLSSGLSFRIRSSQSLRIAAANTLVSYCELPGYISPLPNISYIIYAYLNAFELICREDSYCVEKMILCQPKIEQLHTVAKGDYKAMEASSFFHDKLIDLIRLKNSNLEIQSSEYCRVSWKYPLLGLAHVLVVLRDECLTYCRDPTHGIEIECSAEKVNLNIILGLESYSLIEDDEAINYLQLSLKDSSSSSCGVLQDSIAFITLYVIHSRQDNLQGMEESLAGILKLDFEDVDMTCYTSIYYNTVIPFLREVNEIELYKKLRDIHLDSIARIEATVNCEDDPWKCLSRYGYRPFKPSMLAFHRRSAPLWVRKVLTQNTSLFCSVSKAVMAGCESPFPIDQMY